MIDATIVWECSLQVPTKLLHRCRERLLRQYRLPRSSYATQHRKMCNRIRLVQISVKDIDVLLRVTTDVHQSPRKPYSFTARKCNETLEHVLITSRIQPRQGPHTTRTNEFHMSSCKLRRRRLKVRDCSATVADNHAGCGLIVSLYFTSAFKTLVQA